uniref:DUF4939 domain-containing protein n=1 Tax=Xenopus tropicalis TaxID=8364 RepID=A0A803JNP5_XENTR
MQEESALNQLTLQLTALTQAVQDLQGGYQQMQTQIQALAQPREPLPGSASMSAASQVRATPTSHVQLAPEPKIVLPEKFSGDRKLFRTFVNSCHLTFTLNPRTYASESVKVGFVISLLSGEPQVWAHRLLEQRSPLLGDLNAFLQAMAVHYDDPRRTGRRAVEDY